MSTICTNYRKLLIHYNVYYELFILFISASYLAYHSKIGSVSVPHFREEQFKFWTTVLKSGSIPNIMAKFGGVPFGDL